MKILYSVFAAFILLAIVTACSSEDLYDLNDINKEAKEAVINQNDKNTIYTNDCNREDGEGCGGPP